MESLANTELEPLTGIIERMREGDPDAARMIYDRFAAELRAVLSALISRLAKTSYFQFRRIVEDFECKCSIIQSGETIGSRRVSHHSENAPDCGGESRRKLKSKRAANRRDTRHDELVERLSEPV